MELTCKNILEVYIGALVAGLGLFAALSGEWHGLILIAIGLGIIYHHFRGSP